jgi:hypothetical protein
MSRNPERVSDLLAQVRRLLDAGDVHAALAALRQFGLATVELRNAYGVCLLRTGAIAKAIDVYRDLVIGAGGVCLRPNCHPTFVANYATALLLSGNINGCIAALNEVRSRETPLALRLQTAIAQWKRSLSWTQRLLFAIYNVEPKRPLALDFPPGELLERAELRPAA